MDSVESKTDLLLEPTMYRDFTRFEFMVFDGSSVDSNFFLIFFITFHRGEKNYHHARQGTGMMDDPEKSSISDSQRTAKQKRGKIEIRGSLPGFMAFKESHKKVIFQIRFPWNLMPRDGKGFPAARRFQ